MYGFYKIKNDKLLIGVELTQICVGANEIILNFYPYGTSVTVFNVDLFVKDNHFLFDELCGESRKIKQIGKTVRKLSVISNNIAKLAMSDGAEIILKDDSEEYEALTIQCDGQTIVV